MSDKQEPDLTYHIEPLTEKTWQDFTHLFGEEGGHDGCWCMWWRTRRGEFMKMPAEQHKTAMQALVDSGMVPGVLLFAANQAVGWCAIGPRADYYPLVHSKTLKPVDDQPVWSIVCFFVTKDHRQQGAMEMLIDGAVEYARQHGATIVEAYPTDMQSGKMAGKHLTGFHGYMGIASAFRKSGFVEVGRPNEYQLIMRHTIK